MLAAVRHFALSAIGRDRPGIVAAVTGVLLEHEVNIEDSQATILRGHFTMMLVIAVPDTVDPERVRDDLDAVAERLQLEALSLREVGEVEPTAVEPTHIVTVYGVDHPGIVHGVAQALAERGVNITDLNTRVAGEDPGPPAREPLYVLMVEVALPKALTDEALRAALEEVGGRQGVEVSLRELESEEL